MLLKQIDHCLRRHGVSPSASRSKLSDSTVDALSIDHRLRRYGVSPSACTSKLSNSTVDALSAVMKCGPSKQPAPINRVDRASEPLA
jgi:hypothetical protein